ncbi:MAG TPA: hypothetical protein VNQ53_16280 [Nocardioides sp.]|nr:hypothetical protein [Nocardioides sp.]
MRATLSGAVSTGNRIPPCRDSPRAVEQVGSLDELTTYEYGERSGVVEDLAGHRWELTQTVRDVTRRSGVA